MQQIDYNAFRLVRYSKLIDKAILEHRYSLATHLAYRCLLEYHRLFLRFLVPQSKVIKNNAFQLSLVVVRYMRGRRSLTVKRTQQLFGILRSTYAITDLASAWHGDRDLHADFVTATFARDQALATARFLFGSLCEEQKKT